MHRLHKEEQIIQPLLLFLFILPLITLTSQAERFTTTLNTKTSCRPHKTLPRVLLTNHLSPYYCHYLDVFHCAFEWIDHLGHELQPVAGSGVEGPHPGRLGIGCGRSALLLLRLIGKVILILQHLHFQHLTHHVSACAARQREGVSGGGRWKTRPWWEVGGRRN